MHGTGIKTICLSYFVVRQPKFDKKLNVDHILNIVVNLGCSTTK